MRRLPILVCLVAGCGPTSEPGIDAASATGLVVRFVAVPWPATTSTIVVQRAEVRLRDVRIIGDTAPGDQRTSISRVELVWELDPIAGQFEMPAAPPGIYATAQARVSGDAVASYRISGLVDDQSGDPTPFEVIDTAVIDVSVQLGGFVLATGERRQLDLHVDFPSVIDGVAWSSIVADGDGVLRIDEGDPELAETRAGLAAAFSP